MSKTKKSGSQQLAVGKKNTTPETRNQQPAIAISTLRFSIIITGIYFLVVLLGLVNHEMWRDELQAWMVASDAHSIGDLFNNLKYEGNPAVWHLLLFVASAIWDNPISMQIIHICIAVSFVYVFNRYSPFNKLIKILFTFGYYAVYEYSVISRSYGLGLLIIMGICALYPNRNKYYLYIGGLLLILANVTVYGMVISLSFASLLVLDHYFSKDKTNKINLQPLLICVGLCGLGMFLSYLQIKPEPDNTFPVNYPVEPFEWIRFRIGMAQLFKSLFPIPDMNDPFYWNTTIFFSQVKDKINSPYLPLLLLVICLIQFYKKPLVGLFYTGATFALLFLIYYTLLTFNRYVGHLFIVYIVAAWLYHYYPNANYQNFAIRSMTNFGNSLQKYFFIFMLGIGVIAGMIVYVKDLKTPFTYSKQAADYIKENKLDTLTIVGSTDFAISPLATYLHKKIYYPEMQDYGSFTIWNTHRNDSIHFPEVIQSVNKLLQDRNKLLLVMGEGPTRVENGQNIILTNDIISTNVRAVLLKSYPKGAEKNESYFIYMVDKLGPIPPIQNSPAPADTNRAQSR